MPKLQKQTVRKIDLMEITLKDNIRVNYIEIEELAASIERDGQLQPVVISPDFELIAGYRRFHAHKFLVDQGKPFNQIEAIIRTGDAYILQLTENIHRDNLKPAELEKALKKMIETGLTQTEIANRLNKRLSWVSDCLASGKVREKVGTDMSTTALSQARSVPEEKLAEVITEAKKNGGTVKAVKEAVHKSVDIVDKFAGLKREVNKLLKSGVKIEEILEAIG